jgi:WD40 repeat protein
VFAYVEFPDGKVLSGSENGQMLLWDGEFIKMQVSRRDGAPCHAGNITDMYCSEGEIFSAGVDGYIRVWDFETIDKAELSDDATEIYIEIEPKREILVGEGASIRCLARRETDWLIQDSNGGVWTVPYNADKAPDSTVQIMAFHAGPVSGVVASPRVPLIVTAGGDATVRIFDYLQRRELHKATFSAPSSKIGASWA